VFLFSLGGIVTIVVIAGAVVAGVILIPGPSPKTGPIADPTTGPTSSPTAKVAATVCGQGSLQLIGSTAFMPIAHEAAAAYMQACPDAKIEVSDGDSAYGLSQVRQAVAAGSPQSGAMIAMYDGSPSGSATAGLTAYPMGALIFSVVAHNGLFADGAIGTIDLQRIFVKPGKPGTVAVGRRSGSGSRQAFVTKVLGIANPAEADVQPDRGNCPPPTGSADPATSCTEDSTQDLLAFVNKTPNAIGYAETYESLAAYSGVSVLSVDNAQPTEANVLKGSYKYWIVEHLFAGPQPTPLAKDFLGFMPDYFKSNAKPGFIACSQSGKKLEPDC
jgi:ABC-type phosphate transport system substrate-binding protein